MNNQPNTTEEFLRESNAIEGVFDDQSLENALSAWDYLVKTTRLDNVVLKTTHRILMRNQPGLTQDEKGHYRRTQVYIGGKEALHYSQIDLALYGWFKLMNDELTTRDWKMLHVMYEGIHPFIDGNGRTGRMFMNWQRVKNGLPMLVIKNSEKQDYYKWFKED